MSGIRGYQGRANAAQLRNSGCVLRQARHHIYRNVVDLKRG